LARLLKRLSSLVIENNDIQNDSDFLSSIQSDESNNISENDNTINEVSEIINQFREPENNTSSQNESTSKCLNELTRY